MAASPVRNIPAAIPYGPTRIQPADATHNYSVLYYTIQHLMQMHPCLTFQKIERYLRQENCFFYLVALPQVCSHEFELYLCGPEDTLFKTQQLGQDPGYKTNFAQLNQCRLSPPPLRDCESPALLPAKHLSDALSRLSSYFAFQSQSQQPTFIDHWESLTPDQVRAESLRFQGALRSAYTKIFERYPPSENMIEVGSGYYPLIETIPSLAGKVILSDHHEKYLNYLTQQFPDSRNQYFDLLQPLPLSMQGAFDTALMSDVLITLSREELEQAASTLFDLLPPGGRLLHFSVRDSSQSPVYKELTQQGYICCPWITSDERLVGIHAIKNEELIAAVESLGSSHSQLKQALRTYIDWPGQYRELFCFSELCEDHGDACWTNTRGLVASFNVLASAFQMLDCPSLQQVPFDAFHEQMIHNALKRAGFGTLESSRTIGGYTGEKNKELHATDCNTFIINRGDYRQSYSSEISHGKATQIAYVYLLAMQKPK
ncbi:MAG: hypothetical protein V4492_02120 [Chlamydiota bacterium]